MPELVMAATVDADGPSSPTGAVGRAWTCARVVRGDEGDASAV